jgi:hypothetical protein
VPKLAKKFNYIQAVGQMLLNETFSTNSFFLPEVAASSPGRKFRLLVSLGEVSPNVNQLFVGIDQLVGGSTVVIGQDHTLPLDAGQSVFMFEAARLCGANGVRPRVNVIPQGPINVSVVLILEEDTVEN